MLVLGAGASAEVGLPVGSKLLEEIVKLTFVHFDVGRQTKGDPHIVEALRCLLNEGREVERLNEHLRAGWQLSVSARQALSIDNVIDALEDPKIELVGKLGIVRAIHQAERGSTYFKDEHGHFETLDVRKFKGTWYDSLTKLLTENVRKSRVTTIFDNLEIINFNYDRCLEQYLPHSLANYYGMKPHEIREILPALRVHRPYGIAGRLPWQDGDAPAVKFGGGTPQELALAAQQVRTFTEQVEEGDALRDIRRAIANADRIVFLGFAFHRQNVELLSSKAMDHAEVVATAMSISKSDKAVIAQELATALELEGPFAEQQRVDLADFSCATFFQEYWRTLTAERSYD